MLPLAFALVFAVIEYSYYFGAVHYTNYATFAGARAVQANAKIPPGPTGAGDIALPTIENMLLNGNVTRFAELERVGDDAVVGRLPWVASTPGFSAVMGDMEVTMTVVLGRPECDYEGTSTADYSYDSSHPGLRNGANESSRYTDNGLKCSGRSF